MADSAPMSSGAESTAGSPDAGPASSSPPATSNGSFLRGLIRTARPKQWMKNVLVAAAPGAAGILGHGSVIVDTIVAFVAFSLAASGTYFLNDAFDVEADRRHAKKRLRPIAAGIVPVGTAKAIGVVLLGAGIGASFLANWHLALVIGIYVTFTTSYSMWLKHVAVIDLGMVAAGFVLRLIAGAVAVDVKISVWFIVVGSFGSLFMIAGKRHAEAIEMGADRAGFRATLDEYSVEYLGYVRSVSSGVAMVAYCLWAFDSAIHRSGIVWFEVSIVPFVLAFLRYALLVERGQGGAPEDVVLADRPLQVLAAAWVVLVAVGLYVA
jgi:decaprenyl-phosphate phosphoribosyltransferase